MKKKRICFVDDDRLEIARLRSALGGYYDIGAGGTLDDALRDLESRFKARRPDLFLLDMYLGPSISDEERAKIAHSDYEVTKAEGRLREKLVKAGIVAQRGFELAERVRTQFSHVQIAAAFFSRKAFLGDALAAQKRGLPVIEKPDPGPADTGTEDEQYDSAMKRSADLLREEFEGIISRASWWHRHRAILSSFASGFCFVFVPMLIDALTHSSTSLDWARILILIALSVVFGVLAWRWQ
jgi:hypothetical protein